MSIFSNLVKKYKRATPKQLMLSGVFMLALAGAIGGGFASKQTSVAQEIRDCSYNSIDHHRIGGGCGALSIPELCEDLWTNSPSDLQSVYNEFGFQSNDCDTERFQKEGRHGVITKNGDVIVDGEVVMTNAWTMGRTTLGGAQRTPYTINGKTYYHSHPSVSFGQSQLDVMVLFDADGTLEFAVMESCGNPITTGNKVRSGGECKTLSKTAVEGKKNTYSFTTNASVFGLAKIVKYDYYIDEGDGEKLFATKTSGSDAVVKTFTKSATVTVKVTISLPGGKTKVVTSELCSKNVGVVKEEFLYVCDALIATARDNTNRKFRFTVKTKQSNNVSVDSADFTLDNTVTTKGVTDKDASGNFFKDYDFNDTVTHTVSVIVNFTADGKKVTSREGDCVAKVTPEKAPECPEKPGSGLPPGHPDCQLPKTGPAGVAGLFAGVAAAGTIGRHLYVSRKRR